MVAGAGGSYPAITVNVNVPASAAVSTSNTGNVFGGGDLVHTNSGNVATSTDTVAVVQVPATINLTAGNNQTVAVNTAFPTNLSATVLDAGSVPINGATVTFTAPASGASGTFAGGTNVKTATTNASGVATATTYTSNTTVGGPYNVNVVSGLISNNFSETNTAGALDHFAIGVIGPQTAGGAFNITLTAQDANNNTVTGFAGTVNLSTTAGTITPTTSGAFTGGTRTESVTVTQAGASQTITATNGPATGTSNSFTVSALVPTVTSISPTSGSTAGGTVVTITGTNFTGATAVSFGGTAATSFSVTNDTTISATTAASAAGTGLNVSVTTPGGTNTANTLYTYVAPYALGTSALLEGNGAGTDSVALTVTPETGTWTAAAVDSWLTVSTTAGGSSGTDSTAGTGSANVIFTFTANTGATRTGTLTVAGQTLTVTQAGSTYTQTNDVTTLVSTGLSSPQGVAVDGSGNVYIADAGHGAIKKWTAATNTVSTLVSTGLSAPAGVAVDGSGNVYIADTGHNAIKKWTAATNTVSTLVSTGLSGPQGVAVDSYGNVYIADSNHYAIRKWTAASNTVSTVVTAGVADPIVCVAVDGSGNVYFTETYNKVIKKWKAATQTVSTLVGGVSPAGVAVDGSGNVYYSDGANLAIKKWTAATQTVSTLSGASPAGVAVDGSGNVYFASGSTFIRELPYAFVDATAKNETAASGTDALPVVLPATANLLAPFAPTSDSAWLTIGTISSGVVNFGFTLNNTVTSRTGHITVLGVQTTITQAADVPASITVSSGSPQSATVNTAYGAPLVVTVNDADNNPVSGVSVTFTAPGSGASGVFSNSTATITVATDSSGTASSGTFTANTVAGSYNVSAAATGAGSANFSLTSTAGAAFNFTVSAPGGATAGAAFNFTVTALDQFNNVATGYTGAVTFSGTDAQAILPANSTLTNGVGTFSATLKTAGNQTLTATDTMAPGITGTSGNVAVSPAAASHFTVSAPGTATAGVAFNVTVTALDQFNNVATGYTGAAHFTGSDAQATLPANYTFVAGDAGVHVFAATLKTVGNQAVTATDTVAPGITGTSGNVAVSPAAASHFTIGAPASTAAGAAISVTVTALDAFNNTATGYAGTVHFTKTDSAAGSAVPVDYTFVPGDSGVHTFTNSVTFVTGGNQTVTATDTVTTSITGTSSNVNVVQPPIISASFNPVQIPLNGNSTLTFTITNPAGNTVALTGVAFSQDLPAGLAVGTPNGLTNTTGGTATATAAATGANAITLTGGTIASGSSATVSVTINGSGAGTFNITSSAVTSTNGGTGNTALSTLSTNRPPNATPVISARSPSGSVKIPVSQILAAALDPDAGDIVTLVSVGNPTAPAHGTATYTGNGSTGFVFYTPKLLPGGTVDPNPDTFSYTVTDNHGAQATSTVTINVTGSTSAVSSQITKQTRAPNGTVSLSFAGVPGYTVGLQFTDDLTHPWVNVSPPLPPMNAVGQATYTDSAHNSSPNVFYRLIYPAP